MKMRISTFFFLVILISSGLNTMSQVAINNDGSAPDGSAILDVKSTTKGFLLPRLTNIQRDDINSPAAGLFIFNTDEHAIQFYDGSLWKYFSPDSCVPQQPESITGNEYPDCNQTAVTYSTTEVSWASSYNWLVPEGATITSGQGSTDVTVNMGTQSGNLSVRAESGCGNSAYKDLPITIGTPAQPNSITGNAYPECNATSIAYSTDAVNGATYYKWLAPTDATITSGQGTTNILVSFVTNSGDISVRAANSCGVSGYSTLAISIGIPAQPGSITGNIIFDANATGETYSIDAANGATLYNWTVPTGATIASGQGTTNITVDFGTTSGNVSVRSENNCGNSNYSDLAVTLFTCGDQYTDTRNSQTYNTISIGSQCWFVENLNIGTRINVSYPQSDNSIIEKYCYDNDPTYCETYGGLYQWNEMMQYSTTQGIQGICPNSWHLPTDDEWKTMEMALGMSQSEAGNTGWRGTDEGEKIKSTTGWNSSGNGTNSSGFTALPGGMRGYGGGLNYLGNHGYWWSSSEYSGLDAWHRQLGYDSDQVSRNQYNKDNSHSVRCLR